LTAYCSQKLTGGAKRNVIVQLYEEAAVNMLSSIVISVSSVALNAAGSAAVLAVVPDTPLQLSETSNSGGWLNFIDLACHSYFILHTSVVLRLLSVA